MLHGGFPCGTSTIGQAQCGNPSTRCLLQVDGVDVEMVQSRGSATGVPGKERSVWIMAIGQAL